LFSLFVVGNRLLVGFNFFVWVLLVFLLRLIVIFIRFGLLFLG